MWHTHSFIFKFHILCNAKIVNNKIESLIYLVLAHSNTTVVCWSFSQCVRCFFFAMYKYLLYLCNVLKNQIICSLYLKITVNVFSSEWQCDEIFDPWFLTPGSFHYSNPTAYSYAVVFSSMVSISRRYSQLQKADSAETSSAVSVTLRSQTCWCHWHCGVKFVVSTFLKTFFL